MSIFENLFDQLNVDGQTSLISALGWLLAIERQLKISSSDGGVKTTDVGNINNVDSNLESEKRNEAIL